ncbi:unnamed protein product [Caretta caretta]
MGSGGQKILIHDDHFTPSFYGLDRALQFRPATPILASRSRMKKFTGTWTVQEDMISAAIRSLTLGWAEERRSWTVA